MTERKNWERPAHEEKISDNPRCLSLLQIHNYLEGKLEQSEKEKIDEHLEHCPLCADAVDGYRTIEDWEKSCELISTIEKKVVHRITDQQNGKTEWRRYFSIAAVLLLVSTIIFYIFNSMATGGTDKIFNEYFVLYPNTTPIVRSEVSADTFLQAMSAYEIEDFNTALNLLEKVLAQNPANAEARFYAGMASLELHETAKSIDYFKSVAAIETSEFKQHSQWYLALAFLKNQDEKSAMVVLKEIAASGRKYQKFASELITKLSK